MIIFAHRLPEDGTLVPKHAGVKLIIVFNDCVLLSVSVGQYIEYMETHGGAGIAQLIL